jgi:hypothetical protein
MIYECTDCQYCADFVDGFRVFCVAPNGQPNDVVDYHPVGDGDASDCPNYYDDLPIYFLWSHLEEAESHSEEKFGEVTYEGIKDWIVNHEKYKEHKELYWDE